MVFQANLCVQCWECTTWDIVFITQKELTIEGRNTIQISRNNHVFKSIVVKQRSLRRQENPGVASALLTEPGNTGEIGDRASLATRHLQGTPIPCTRASARPTVNSDTVRTAVYG